jgi:hypothetical protein
VCEMLRIIHCQYSRLIEFGVVVSLKRRPRSTPKKYFLFPSGTHETASVV